MHLLKARCVVYCVVAYFTALGSLGNYDHCNRSMTLVIFSFLIIIFPSSVWICDKRLALARLFMNV